jgi:exopolysaccharide/PEP-CTERM locus tyrosine autokinase
LPERGLERRFADHYRQIKRPLIDRALSGSAESHLILVTSALPGDGKTFTSINLALSMARERDISVVLVDADTPRARVSEVLGLRREPGLLDALRDESLDVDSLIRRTDIRGLEVLPAGTMVENATELLASTRMAQVAARICGGSARRLAIFDSAPLLVSSESRVLCRLPGQLVLVVRAGVTPKHALLEAIGHLDKTRLQGVILNQTPFRASGGYYGYSQYGEDAEERQRTD